MSKSDDEAVEIEKIIELLDKIMREEVFESSDEDHEEVAEDGSEDSVGLDAERLWCVCQGVECGKMVKLSLNEIYLQVNT